MAKNIAALGISLLVMMVLAEICLWLIFPIGDPYAIYKRGEALEARYIESQFQPNQRYYFYPELELSHMAEKARFTTNNLGFRGAEVRRPKPSDEYRIFMVGGSTTECLYLDDTLAVTHVLESFLTAIAPDRLTVRVYSAGKSGDRTYDHLAMISQRIIHLEPDMIILFCGMNDLTAAIYGADYIHLPTSYSRAVTAFDLIKYMLTEFQLPRRLYYAYKGIWKAQVADDMLTAISFKSHYREAVELRKSYPVTDDPPRVDLESYRKNLVSIIGVAQAHDIPLVLVTQATTWNSAVDPRTAKWHWGTLKKDIVYREDLMDKAMDLYNHVMRETAAEYSVPVFDLALLMPKSLDFFYDDCHFNIPGAQKAGRLMGAFLIEIGLFDAQTDTTAQTK